MLASNENVINILILLEIPKHYSLREKKNKHIKNKYELYYEMPSRLVTREINFIFFLISVDVCQCCKCRICRKLCCLHFYGSLAGYKVDENETF